MSTHYKLSVNSNNELRLTHKFDENYKQVINMPPGWPGMCENDQKEVISFEYSLPSQGEKDAKDKDDRFAIGHCSVNIFNEYSYDGPNELNKRIVVRLESSGPVPFKKAKVTLLWEERIKPDVEHPSGKIAKEIVLNFRPKIQTQEIFCNDGINNHVGNFCLQIIADLDEGEDNSLASDWGARFNDNYLSDIKVVAGKSSFHCHKIVLASRSDVFKAMFSHGNLKECLDGELILEEDSDIVDHFLQFLYTDEVKGDLDDNSAAKLLVMGDKYNMSKLKKTCSRILSNHMDTDNCCQILVTAHLHLCDILEKECCAYITKNIADVMQTEGWTELGCSHPQIVGVVIRHLPMPHLPMPQLPSDICP
jgi:hypothetical protein